MTDDDFSQAASDRLRRLFVAEVAIGRAARLLDKTPINSFRLSFVHANFADARFVHIVRHGVQVANSMASYRPRVRWHGFGDYKWRQIEAHAMRSDRYRDLLPLCTGQYDRGMLEWRMSLDAAFEFFEDFPRDRHLTVSYDDLMHNPPAVTSTVEKWMGLEPSREVRRFAVDRVRRRTPEADRSAVPATARAIAGDLLDRLDLL